MALVPPIIVILVILAILLIGQQTRLGAREALISQKIDFEGGAIFLSAKRFGIILITKCRFLPMDDTFMPKISYSISQNDSTIGRFASFLAIRLHLGIFRKNDSLQMHVVIEVRNYATATELLGILQENGCDTAKITIPGNRVAFTM